MDKKKAEEILGLLEGSININNDSFTIEEVIREPHLVGFARWDLKRRPYRTNYGAFLVRKKGTNFMIWMSICYWNKTNGYYLIVYRENGRRILMEIHKINGSCFEWRYIPVRRDGKNPKRREIFAKRYGSVHVSIPIPTQREELTGFIEEIFRVAKTRIKADKLVEPKNVKPSS